MPNDHPVTISTLEDHEIDQLTCTEYRWNERKLAKEPIEQPLTKSDRAALKAQHDRNLDTLDTIVAKEVSEER